MRVFMGLPGSEISALILRQLPRRSQPGHASANHYDILVAIRHERLDARFVCRAAAMWLLLHVA